MKLVVQTNCYHYQEIISIALEDLRYWTLGFMIINQWDKRESESL